MSKYIPVEPEKWAEMVKAQSDLPRWKEMCDELEARCNELKAEVERLRKAGDNLARASDENGCHDNGDADDLDDAIERWKAAREGKPSV